MGNALACLQLVDDLLQFVGNGAMGLAQSGIGLLGDRANSIAVLLELPALLLDHLAQFGCFELEAVQPDDLQFLLFALPCLDVKLVSCYLQLLRFFTFHSSDIPHRKLLSLGSTSCIGCHLGLADIQPFEDVSLGVVVQRLDLF